MKGICCQPVYDIDIALTSWLACIFNHCYLASYAYMLLLVMLEVSLLWYLLWDPGYKGSFITTWLYAFDLTLDAYSVISSWTNKDWPQYYGYFGYGKNYGDEYLKWANGWQMSVASYIHSMSTLFLNRPTCRLPVYPGQRRWPWQRLVCWQPVGPGLLWCYSSLLRPQTWSSTLPTTPGPTTACCQPLTTAGTS